MLPADTLTLAIDIHGRCYRLLKWLDGALSYGALRAQHIHDDSVPGDAAYDWFNGNLLHLPVDARPAPRHLQEFANYFGTYLTSSFDIVEKPGARKIGSGPCYCSVCTSVVNTPLLKTKRLTQKDKRHARNLMVDRILQLAQEEHRSVTAETAERIGEDPKTRVAAAYSAYGWWLIQRMQGVSEGKAILALWREIAWEPTGTPIKGFKLCVADFVEAEQSLLAAISSEPAESLNSDTIQTPVVLV